VLKKFKIILSDPFKEIIYIMYNLAFLFLIMFFVACTTPKKTFYIKARNNEEVKTGAFEICGRDFKILTYEEDTVLVSCTKKK